MNIYTFFSLYSPSWSLSNIHPWIPLQNWGKVYSLRKKVAAQKKSKLGEWKLWILVHFFHYIPLLHPFQTSIHEYSCKIICCSAYTTWQLSSNSPQLAAECRSKLSWGHAPADSGWSPRSPQRHGSDTASHSHHPREYLRRRTTQN